MVQGERMQRKRNRESREPRSFFRHGIPLMHQTTKRQGTIQNRFSGRINSAKAAIATDANRKTRRCVLMNFRKKKIWNARKKQNSVSEMNIGATAMAVGFNANRIAAASEAFHEA